MTVQFKLNVEQYSEYFGSKFKDDPVEAVAAIRTKTGPMIVEPTKPTKGSDEVNVIIWKDDYLEFKRKERIWVQINPRIFNMVLGQCTPEMKIKLGGREGRPVILKAKDGVSLLKTIHRLSN